MKSAHAVNRHPHSSHEMEVLSDSPFFKNADGKTVQVEPEALGRLRRELIWTVGNGTAKGILVRFGYSCGLADLRNGASTPFLIRGLGRIRKANGEQDSTDQTFDVADSCEAFEHVIFYGRDASPQCWTLAGYLTGVMSDQNQSPLYFIETQCAAKGDSRCRFIGKTRDQWMMDGEDLTIYDEDNLSMELSALRQQLKLTKERYQNLFEQSSMSIFITDPDTGAYLNANVAAEELTGYTREEILKMKIFDLRHPNEHHEAIAQMKALVANGKVNDEEIRIVRKDGMVLTIAHSSKLLPYGGKRVVQTIMRDITDLKVSSQKEKDLQRQLLRSERLSSIGRLAAGVAHELKNPLGAIRNAIYYVRNGLVNNPILETDPNMKEILKLAESEIDGAVTIIGELLDFSRVVQLVPRQVQINELLERLPSVINIPDSVNLAWDLDLTLPSAMVDPERLSQVFSNIANNAVQAMPQGGILSVRSQFVVESGGSEATGSERIVITIEDTGVGIEPLHLAKIFEPLFTTKARGTGLGLTISSNIIEKHGGVILVTSQVGKGTSFTIKLPLKPPPDREELS